MKDFVCGKCHVLNTFDGTSGCSHGMVSRGMQSFFWLIGNIPLILFLLATTWIVRKREGKA